ncbi:histidine phosphatase family protein [Vibrio hannami]|uniref:histidine phosphatase family protein n=1 Tax=Vibrio hannami TaxID=2717094 RepID=UPI00240F76D7|nr:histidine phosphatase family protein [Vibrio hannami]MDG3085189.1 histidine phosphatase family protein [Vibrio hannami]
MTTTRIELLRHGLPEGDDCFRGHTDFAITETGFQQMHDSASGCQNIDLVVTSPLSRCKDFALEYADKYDLEVIEEPAFKELNFGDWDGVPKQKVWETNQELLMKFWSHPWETLPPNGEGLKAYDQRIQQAWLHLLEQHQGKSILLVTHGGVIKQLLRQILEIPETATYLQRLNIPYAARVTITVYHDDQGKLWPEVHWS